MSIINSLIGGASPLKIEAFTDAEFKKPADASVFTTSMTPERYTYHYKIETNKDQASGTTTTADKFDKILPEELELDILFDRTGVLREFPITKDGVINDLNTFKDTVIKFDGKSHHMHYVKITWGSLLFQGRLTEMNIEFKLFRQDGTPIRANAKVKFSGTVEDKLRVAREDRQSPDLTHLRVVKEGDTLPLMTYNIYGDSKYYLHVAKVNGLANFRKLTPGQQIWFPPIEKRS